MSDEYNKKRARSDDEDDERYDPEPSMLPPHLMDAAEDGVKDYNENKDAENLDNSYEPEISQFPPHMAGGRSIPANKPFGNSQMPTGPSRYVRNQGDFNNSNSGNMKKRQRNLNMSKEIEKANDLCLSLANIGDLPYELKFILEQNSELISQYWMDSDFSGSIKSFLASMATEMPHKSVLLSGFIILSNFKNSDIGNDVLSFFKDRIEEVFSSMNNKEMDVDNDSSSNVINMSKSWNRIVLITRMLALLTPIIKDVESVFKFMKDLLELSIKLQSDENRRSPLGELLFYEITLSIPFFLVNESNNEEIKLKCLELIEVSKKFKVCGKDDKNDEFFKPIHNFDENKLTSMNELLKEVCQKTEEYLDDMKIFYDNKPVINPLLETIKKNREELLLAKDTAAEDENVNDLPTVDIVKHDIGNFEIPDFDIIQNFEDLKNEFSSHSDKLWANPRYIINIFQNERVRKDLEFETIPLKNTYISMILNDTIEDILSNLEYNRVILSKQLLNFQHYFNEKLFSKFNSPIDKLMIINDLKKGIDFDLIKNLEESTDFEEHVKYQMITSAKKIQVEFELGYTSTLKIEEIFIENIINWIFLIPKSELPLIYFETLLVDICGRDFGFAKKAQFQGDDSLVISKLIGDCFRYFYENIENFEFENIIRFINWFLFQISNFKFEWEWEEWISDLIQLGDDKLYNPKILFIKNLIHKEVLVTNYKFIRDRTLPEDLKKFINLSIKNKEELIKYDSKFFGEVFSKENSNDPFENEIISTMENQYIENPNGGNANETNTDIYKLFQHYLFNHDEHPFNELCRDIYMNLENVEENVETFLELTNKLKDRINNGNEEIVENSDEYIITLVVESICLIGSRSFSVFEESLNKVFGDKLNAILNELSKNNSKEELNNWVINAVLRIWNNEPRIGLMFIDKLIRFGVLDEVSIIKFIWKNDENLLPITEIYIDEYLNNLIDYIDEEDGEEAIKKQEDMINVYLKEAILKINKEEKVFEISELNKLNEYSSEEEWKFKHLIGFMQKNFRKYGSKIDVSKLLQEVEREDVRNVLWMN